MLFYFKILFIIVIDLSVLARLAVSLVVDKFNNKPKPLRYCPKKSKNRTVL